jgi:hypothetical protein
MNPDDVTLPETETERDLLDTFFTGDLAPAVGVAILAIEAEARAPLEAQVATLREALSFALDLLDLYDERLVAIDGVERVYTPIHVAGKARARAVLATPSTEILARIKAEAVAKERAGYDASFNLRWKADMRAIKAWQKATGRGELVWPDHADLCVWLLNRLTDAVSLLENYGDHHEWCDRSGSDPCGFTQALARAALLTENQP